MATRERTLVAVAALLLAAGCGGDDTAGATSSPSSPSPSATASAPSQSATPTAPAAPSVTPATGRRIDVEQLSFVLPRSFTDMGGYGNGLVSGQTWASEELGSIVTLGLLAELTEYTLDEAAELALTSREATTREPDRVVGGEPVWMLIDRSTPALTTYEVGRVVDGSLLSLTFDFQRDEPSSIALMESILATVEWKV